MMGSDDIDFGAGNDAHILLTSDEIMKDPGRAEAARNFAKMQKEKFAAMEQKLPQTRKRAFNNAVHDSKMRPKNA